MWQERLSEFVTLFVVVNPIAVLPIFVAVTANLDATTRRRVAVNAVLISLFVLVFFVLAGGFLLEKMGVSLRAFQIAGGIVLFVFALGMVQGHTHEPESGTTVADTAMALAIYPLAIPKIAGPGTILSVVLLTDDDRFDLLEQGRTVLIIALVLAIQLAVLLAADWLMRFIGKSGASVIGRVMGMVLAALAVNMVLTGFGSWLNLPKL